jgi:hypothetical protein
MPVVTKVPHSTCLSFEPLSLLNVAVEILRRVVWPCAGWSDFESQSGKTDCPYFYIVTYRRIRVTIMTASSSDD